MARIRAVGHLNHRRRPKVLFFLRLTPQEKRAAHSAGIDGSYTRREDARAALDAVEQITAKR